jgi:two-component system, NtrC family, nitrogen regulation sensor histidine kinase NtrY
VSGFVGPVKVPVVYGVILLLGLILYLALMMVRGQRYVLTFRDQLLGAMLLTALVPLGLLLVYSQYEVRNRVMESTARRLEAETAAIALDIAGIGEHADASSEFSLRPERVELIASNAGTDFNLYVDNELRISSRPELYAAGLLDTRINGSAFAAVTLSGRRFHMQTENIGLFRYVVGYRPVLDAAGGIIGIVSVPTLYRQDELERELYDRNAVLFGIYAVVLTLVLVMTTLLANRIAAPLQRLTALTRDVAAGDLQIAARLPRAEGEIGELVHAFENMTRDLRASRDNLVQAERELAWKEMARQVAHEIKNPLTPMRLSIQHLRQTYRDRVPDFGEILDQVTRTVIEQIDTLSRIASEFSSFARMPRRILEACDVREVVTAAVQLFEQDARVVFDVTTDADLPALTADREELRRAFINIIRNGVQAMNGRGRMVISVQRRTGMVRITFRDTGAGIPDELKSKLFQPNFSTKTDGMGLGLAIVKKTVDDLGGSVRIESEMGKGTTVSVDLPLPESRQSTS